MLIRLGYEMIFDVPIPTPMVLMLYTHPSVVRRLTQPEQLWITPAVEIEDYIDGFGNRCARIVAPAGKLRISYDNTIQDSGLPEPAYPEARQHPVEELPAETLQFLLPSRYCEVDLLADTAWKLFSETTPGWGRVQAVCDWVHNHVEFGYPHARPTKTARETLEEGRGVCRDFMHLAITFCRCLNIPARYATGYLGDIGVVVPPAPMDFSAFFEVYLEGAWHPFDARNNVRRIGRVLMARGRDAADTALTTSFGPTPLDKFTVWTDEIQETPLVPHSVTEGTGILTT